MITKQGQRSSVVPAKFNAIKWKNVQKAKIFQCWRMITIAFQCCTMRKCSFVNFIKKYSCKLEQMVWCNWMVNILMKANLLCDWFYWITDIVHNKREGSEMRFNAWLPRSEEFFPWKIFKGNIAQKFPFFYKRSARNLQDMHIY